MAASYPAATPAFSVKLDGPGNTIAAAHTNSIQDEVVALATGLRDGLAHDLKFTDASYDIGKSGATRPRHLYLSGNLVVGGTATITGVASAPGVPVLLHAATGSTTTASTENVSTIALTGLTAKDTLVVEVTLYSATAGTASPMLYSVTDAVRVAYFNASNGNMTANQTNISTVKLRQRPDTATRLLSYSIGNDNTTGVVGGSNTWDNPTIAAWTGSWTLALRHGGVTAGGTLHWSWSIHKWAGQ